MGKHFCVCNDANNLEIESNIFSGMQKNKHLGKETIKTLNSDNQINQNFTNKSFQDDNSTNNNNYSLNLFVNEMYKYNNKYRQDFNNNYNKPLSEINKHEGFQCSGKFNVLLSSQNYQIPNGGNDCKDNNSLNISDKNINNGDRKINKNEFSFTNFKPFVDGNNNIGIKDNKDNNTNNSIEINKNNKDNIINKSSEYNDTQKMIQNDDFPISKDDKIENGSSLNEKNDNYNDYRYNNISQYSDVSDKEYLNNESNYYNSNKREEERDIRSLYYEDSHNSEE